MTRLKLDKVLLLRKSVGLLIRKGYDVLLKPIRVHVFTVDLIVFFIVTRQIAIFLIARDGCLPLRVGSCAVSSMFSNLASPVDMR